MGAALSPGAAGGARMLPLPPGMIPPVVPQVGGVMMPPAGSFDFGVSPRDHQSETVGGTMLMAHGGPDSHRSFAGALDGVGGGGGDPLDGFVVHSRFVRADAPIGEGEGGGLVPSGVTVDPGQFAAALIHGGGGGGGGGGRVGRGGVAPTRADHDRTKQANLIGRGDGRQRNNGVAAGGGGGVGAKKGGKAATTVKRPAWGGGGGATKGKTKPHRWV